MKIYLTLLNYALILLILQCTTIPKKEKFTSNKSKEKKDFIVFDALLHKKKPDLAHLGFKKIQLVYSGKLWPEGLTQEEPSEQLIRKVARSLENIGTPIVLDIEHWKVTGDTETVDLNIKKLIRVISLMRNERPELTFGYYGVLPIFNYWDNQKEGEEATILWEKPNIRLHELAEHVDAIFPPFYTHYTDEEG